MARSVITTLEDAMKYVKKRCQWDQFPELTDTTEVGDSDLESLLADNVLGTVWVAETAAALGEEIIPTEDNRTGRRFRCVNPGVTSETEPSWSDGASWTSALNGGVAIGNMGSERLVIWDGTAAWVDAGSEGDLWDLDEVIHEAWRLKAQKCANLISSNQAGNNHQLSELRKNFLEEADRWGGRFIV